MELVRMGILPPIWGLSQGPSALVLWPRPLLAQPRMWPLFQPWAVGRGSLAEEVPDL